MKEIRLFEAGEVLSYIGEYLYPKDDYMIQVISRCDMTCHYIIKMLYKKFRRGAEAEWPFSYIHNNYEINIVATLNHFRRKHKEHKRKS